MDGSRRREAIVWSTPIADVATGSPRFHPRASTFTISVHCKPQFAWHRTLIRIDGELLRASRKSQSSPTPLPDGSQLADACSRRGAT